MIEVRYKNAELRPLGQRKEVMKLAMAQISSNNPAPEPIQAKKV
jgi:hypothetical protein